MTFAAKGPAPGGRADPLELSSYSGVDIQANIPNEAPAQENYRASEITCGSMRADELRGCLIFEISRVMAIGRLAQEALLDSDDDAALANLRWHWRVTRAGITPLACELAALRRARAVP